MDKYREAVLGKKTASASHDLAHMEASDKYYQAALTTKNHQVFMTDRLKSGVNSYDDKRYVRDDNVHTYAHGHWRIREETLKRGHLEASASSCKKQRVG